MERHGGRFPTTEAALRQLPGIGRYTAAAIAAIAFGRRAVVVDANVERVVSRLFAVERPLPAAREELYRLADTITPVREAGDFAQAMMDLGATWHTSLARLRPVPAERHLRRACWGGARALSPEDGEGAKAATRGHRLLARA